MGAREGGKAPPEEVRAVLATIGKVEPVLVENVVLPSLTGEGGELPDGPAEPVYDRQARDDIQGNIIPGFNKDHQHFVFYRIRSKRATKTWLRLIAPAISSLDDVLNFVRLHRSLRHRFGSKEPGLLKSTWVNIAFSNAAIAKLVGEQDAAEFGDESFRQGMAARSRYLGDPAKPTHPGNVSKWVVGGPRNEADIMVIAAADDPHDLDAAVALIRAGALEHKLKLLFEQRGDTLPEPLRGHEHFGFKDGVSQPGVRGKVSAAPGDFITPRYIDPADPRARLFARPGQLLVWPGQFLLGEPRQDPQSIFKAAAPATNFPAWARRGSYLVFRRLRQDVPAFWNFVIESAAALGMSSERFASMLVGRWPSGAPLMRTPDRDDPVLAGDSWANNHFVFDDDTRPSNLRAIAGYPGDHAPQAKADVLGGVCPHFAHIRKSNPRDSATDLGRPADALIRAILRRGIPFGPPLAGVNGHPPNSEGKSGA
jgi:Dyp-type peroxidase family